MERYIKNIDNIFFNEKDQEILLNKSIAVIGCGGQGGYILSFLARLGINTLYFWDGDIFEISNLNRQWACTEETIGQNKAIATFNQLKKINSSINLQVRDWYFGEKNEDVVDLLHCDMVIMASDNSYNSTLVREMVKVVINRGIPCIDEWLRGPGGEVSIITKDSLDLWDENTKLWELQDENSQLVSQPAYRCAYMAAETVNQLVQYFTMTYLSSLNHTLRIDMYHHQYSKYDKYGQF